MFRLTSLIHRDEFRLGNFCLFFKTHPGDSEKWSGLRLLSDKNMSINSEKSQGKQRFTVDSPIINLAPLKIWVNNWILGLRLIVRERWYIEDFGLIEIFDLDYWWLDRFFLSTNWLYHRTFRHSKNLILKPDQMIFCNDYWRSQPDLPNFQSPFWGLVKVLFQIECLKGK